MDKLRQYHGDATDHGPTDHLDQSSSDSIGTFFDGMNDEAVPRHTTTFEASEDDWPVDPRSLSSRWSLGRSAVVAVALIVLIAVAMAWWANRPVSDAPDENALADLEQLDGDFAAHNAGLNGTPAPAEGTAAPDADSAMDSTSADPAQNGTIAVHVVGQVRRPGLVYIAAGGRWADAINAAGGLRKNAAAGAINLAELVADGQQIYVPKKGSGTQSTHSSSGGASNSTTTGVGDNSSSGPDASDSADPVGTGTGRVDINAATEEQLQQLPGIGPALAGQIVSWRQSAGGCTNPEQLLSVPGIGTARYAALADLVSC